jgi:diaminopimelate decarboxylase
MHGNAKSDEDITAALEAGIGYIAVDGFDDIDRIARFARYRRGELQVRRSHRTGARGDRTHAGRNSA